MSSQLDWNYINAHARRKRDVLNGELDRLHQSYQEWMDKLVAENNELKAEVARLKEALKAK